MIIQNYKFVLVDSRGLWPLASAIQEKPSPPIPVVGKTGKTETPITEFTQQQLAQFDPNPCHSTNVTSQCLYEPQNKRTGVKREIYIIYKYHGGDFWPLLQLQAAMPVTEITPQQPSYFESKSACTWHVVSIYPPQGQVKRIGEKNSISMI